MPRNNGTSVIKPPSLPGGSVTLYYGDPPASEESAVVLLPFGYGVAAFLGWDWFNAEPVGTQGGGWLDVLNRTIRDVAGPMSIRCPSDATVECTSPAGTEYPVTVDFAGDSGGLSRSPTGYRIVQRVNGVEVGVLNQAPGVILTLTLPRMFSPGTSRVEFEVTSEVLPRYLPRRRSCFFTVNVVDTTPPAITCPPPVRVELSSVPGTPVSYPPPTVTDVCDPSPSVSCDPPSGMTFPLGTTTVTCTAEDASGNVSTCTFDVTVVDTTPPAIECPPNLTVECAGPDGTAVSYPVPPTIRDFGRLIRVSYFPLPGSDFPLGSSPVDVTVTDPSGNSSTCRFFVTVVDRTAPVVTCPPDVTVECAGPAGTPATWPAPTASDLCDRAPRVEVSHAAGSLFPLGTTDVVVQALDASGNVGSCTFRVNVVDTTAPVVTCPPGPVVECTGPAGTPVTWSPPTVTDGCDPAPTVACVPPPAASSRWERPR